MADAPEIPEANNPFDKQVALTIAILAICLSFIENLGDNAKTDAIIKTNEASNQWAYFQAKSIKGGMAEVHADLLSRLSGATPAEGTKEKLTQLAQQVAKYGTEKAEIQKKAEELQQAAGHQSSINDRCDQSALFLQIAVVICSVSILAKSPKFWWAGMALGVAGVAIGLTAFLM
jgi:hypothetical protein